jgi:hypothetical protein
MEVTPDLTGGWSALSLFRRERRHGPMHAWPGSVPWCLLVVVQGKSWLLSVRGKQVSMRGSASSSVFMHASAASVVSHLRAAPAICRTRAVSISTSSAQVKQIGRENTLYSYSIHML